MSKLGYILRCVKEMNVKAMFRDLNEIHRLSGKNRVFLFCDMVWCGFRYGTGYRDYRLTEWWNLNGAQRKTYVTRGINNSLIKKCNDPAYYHLLNNKVEFNRLFNSELGRGWLYLKEASEEQFAAFLSGKEWVVAKPVDGSCGKGFEKIHVPDYSTAAELYRYLIETDRLLVEDFIVQHPTLAAIYPHSVNTLRVVTILSKDGEPHILYAFLRLGNGGRNVDNISSGGMTAPVDVETGVISNVAFDKKSNYYEVHPETGSPIVGVTIPMWDKVVRLVLDAARKIPQLRYIGWDVAVTETGVEFVEGNQHPGHGFLQMPRHTPDKIGMLPRFRQFIDN